MLSRRSRRHVPPPQAYLPLRRLVLCLDCETCFDIAAPGCPTCGSESWAVLGRFIADAWSKRLGAGDRPDHGPQGGPGARVLLIVAGHQVPLYQRLTRAFAGEASVQVLLDRRGGERRSRSERSSVERRSGDRRAHASVEDLVRTIGWALVRVRPGKSGPESDRARTAVAPRSGS
jgi:hypothetical protein